MNPTATTSTRKPIIVLGFCCVLWGLAFPGTKMALEVYTLHVRGGVLPSVLEQAADSATLSGWRFLIGAVCYAAITWKSQRKFSKFDGYSGALIGGMFAIGVTSQLVGLTFTQPSISAFLTSLTVVFAPLAQAFIFRRPVSGLVWGAVLLALVGAVVISLPSASIATVPESKLPLPAFPFLGEVLTLGCTLLFTAQLLTLDRFGGRCNTECLTLSMLLMTALACLIFGAAFGGNAVYDAHILRALFSEPKFVWPCLSNTFLAGCIAMHLMSKYQPQVTPATASVVYCMEPVFATLFSLLLGMENISVLIVLGGILIFSAVLLVASFSEKPKVVAS